MSNGLTVLAFLWFLLMASFFLEYFHIDINDNIYQHLHRTKVDCYEKAIECLDGNGEKGILQGKKKPTSVRMVKVKLWERVCIFCTTYFQ